MNELLICCKHCGCESRIVLDGNAILITLIICVTIITTILGLVLFYNNYKKSKKITDLEKEKKQIKERLSKKDDELKIAKEELDKVDKKKEEKLNENRKHLVSSLYMSDESFIEEWLKDIPNSTNPYPIESEIYTNKGEHVRSKSERIIADELYRLGIPYKYEASLNLGGQTVVYPDFTVLNVKTRKTWYLEHLGMLDNEEYLQNIFSKMSQYIQNGIIPGKNLIITYEKSDSPLNTKNLEILLKEYLV